MVFLKGCTDTKAVLSRAWDKEKLLSTHEESNLRLSDSTLRWSKLNISLILFTNMTLSTLLILTVCRMSVIHELRSKSPSPYSLCGSVVEHWSSKAQLEFLMGTQFFFFDPRSWQDEKHHSLFLYRAQNLSFFFIWFTNIVLVLFLFLLRQI